jgi:hypothetical protein
MKCWKNRWKRRAVKSRLKLKKLQKRLEELETSRDLWKNKTTEKVSQINELRDELNKLKKN